MGGQLVDVVPQGSSWRVYLCCGLEDGQWLRGPQLGEEGETTADRES